MPLKFKKLLNVPNKIQQVALLGNCNKSASFLKFINGVSENVVYVRGEFDPTTITTPKNSVEELPLNTVIVQGSFRIGCCSSYTLVPKNDPLSLLTLARQLDVDILLWGGTHNVEAYTLEGKFFINPGSCTGAFSTDWVQEDVIENYKTGVHRDSTQTTTTDTDEQQVEQKEEKKEEESLQESGKNDEEKTESTEINSNSVRNPELNENEGDSSDDEFDDIDINGGGIPSFCLLDIQDITCTLYIYTFVDNEVKVDKVVYQKD